MNEAVLLIVCVRDGKKILKSWKFGDLFLFVYRKLFSNHAEVVGKSLLKNKGILKNNLYIVRTGANYWTA